MVKTTKNSAKNDFKYVKFHLPLILLRKVFDLSILHPFLALVEFWCYLGDRIGGSLAGENKFDQEFLGKKFKEYVKFMDFS